MLLNFYHLSITLIIKIFAFSLFCSHPPQTSYHPPSHHPTELKHPSRSAMSSQNTIHVPHSSKHDQLWSQPDRYPSGRDNTNSDHFHDKVGIEGNSLESNVDTVDSGFSSDRFHTPHHHNRPILPGDQVTFIIIFSLRQC